MKAPKFIVIDLFCGAGGTTTGFTMTDDAIVIACVNHDPKAIKSHWMNHPEVEHFEEDITKMYGYLDHGVFFKSPAFKRLERLVELYGAFYPDAKLILWASLECTNFSKAKGGKARDADSRTLADHLQCYIIPLKPEIIQIENVVEFMAWGPLDEKGKPISKKNGEDWLRWRREICSLGYVDEWRELNSADFGAYTSRNRLFGMFAHKRQLICWPEPTHSKTKKARTAQLFEDANLKPWMPVKDVLDFQDEGQSIFNRKKPLSDKTLERIYAGLVKYVAKGEPRFISKYYSGKPKGKVNSVEVPSSTITTFGNSTIVQTKNFSDLSTDQPAGAITTKDHHALVSTDFLLKYNSTNGKTGKHTPPSIDDPSPVVSTQGRLGLVQPKFMVQRNSGEPQNKIVSLDGPARTLTATGGNQDVVFLSKYHGNGANAHSVEGPAPTLDTGDRIAAVKAQYFIDKTYSGYRNNQSIEQPAGTILPTDKHRLIECRPFLMPTNYSNKPKSIDEPCPTLQASRRHTYIINPSHGGWNTSTDQPCPVIIARQDKAPLYLVQAEEGPVQIAVYDDDSEICILIKEFMAHYHLVDIKMRMLRVHELLKIQGFPDDYQLFGNQSDQKKFIGNSVHPYVVKYWTKALGENLKMAA